jgi:ribosomal protein L11 methyltransferase
MDTALARLDCDEATARRVAALLADSLPGEAAVSAFERDGGWTVELHFTEGFPPDSVRSLFAAAGGKAAAARLRFGTIAERDWIRASLAGLPPVRAGRFVVHGAHHRHAVPANAIGIEIEAALAFGTGHHGTTRGCLLAIDRFAKLKRAVPSSRHPEVAAEGGPRRMTGTAGAVALRGSRFARAPQGDGLRTLDVGTGTGVLAIAAARAFHRKIFATDIDPVAVRVARANARHNRAGALITMRTADGRRGVSWNGSFDLILANILLGPLTRMARTLAQRLAPGGRIVLSGLVPDQANAALAAYRAQGLRLEHRESLENWVTLTMRRGRVAGAKGRP